MNGATDASSPVLKRSTSPRPPAVGEEVKKFHDTSHQYPEQYKKWNMDCNSKAASVEPVDQSATLCTNNVTETRDCTENSPNQSPPAALKWAQSLSELLEDHEGVTLFKKFLKQEGQDMSYSCLLCWFACKGVKKGDPAVQKDLVNTIKKVFSKSVNKISAVSDETKEEIKQRLVYLQTLTDVDYTIFDKAQLEIETYLMKTTYPNFLKSELYIQHLGGWQNELSSEKERIVTPEPSEQLPTVHEDSELHIPSKNPPLTKLNLLLRNKSSHLCKFKAEPSPGLLQSPYSTNYGSYHAKYGSFLPVSARDSEIQSLSSDAQTDDTMSLTDGSNVDYPTHSRMKHKRPQKMMKQQNNPIFNTKDRLNIGGFIPRTQRLCETKRPLTQEEFHAELCKKLIKVAEERKNDEKLTEKLKTVEVAVPDEASAHPAQPFDASARQCHKGKSNGVLDAVFLSGPSEENVQDILDQHISRVFDSGQQTPAAGMLSPTVHRPSSELEKPRVPIQGSCSNEVPEHHSAYSKHSQISQFTVPNSIKYRRDHDTYSTDSAVYDYKSDDNLPIDYSRRCKEHSKRYASKKFSSVTDSSSSCFDSGISCESVPSYSNSSRKTGYNSYRGGSQDAAYSQWSGAPAQQYSFPGFSIPDTTSNLVEASRKLEDENRAAKLRMKKPNKKSFSLNLIEAATANTPPSNDVTVIGYSYGRHAVPYLSKMPGKNITLRQFKSMLSKKGNFRYFFKTASNDFGTGVVFEEVTEDSNVLPLWEGKVFCVIESIDDNSVA